MRAIAALLNGEMVKSPLDKRFRKLTIEMSDSTLLLLEIFNDKDNITTNNDSPLQKISVVRNGKIIPNDSFFPCLKSAFISTFDYAPPQLQNSGKFVDYVIGVKSLSELDIILDSVVEKYKSYQIELSTRMSKMMASGEANAQTVIELFGAKNRFLDIYDSILKESGKYMNRDKGEVEFIFRSDGKSHPYSDLSAGEKQLLLIMLTVFMQAEKEAILLMDEPEISMHIDWQHRLLKEIKAINPKCQIIVSTHSPAMILDGWQMAVVNMEDIMKEIK